MYNNHNLLEMNSKKNSSILSFPKNVFEKFKKLVGNFIKDNVITYHTNFTRKNTTKFWYEIMTTVMLFARAALEPPKVAAPPICAPIFGALPGFLSICIYGFLFALADHFLNFFSEISR